MEFLKTIVSQFHSRTLLSAGGALAWVALSLGGGEVRSVLSVALVIGLGYLNCGVRYRTELAFVDPGYVSDVLRARCLPCHDRGNLKGGDIGDISELRSLLSAGLVIPGYADSSLLMRVIDSKKMPPATSAFVPMPEEEVAAIRHWIESGALLP